MADRTVNGSLFSENGWRLVDTGSCVWVEVPGCDPPVQLQIREGQPAAILGAFAADYNAHVEKLRNADSACWTETNDVLGRPGSNMGSNHLSGTGEDLNWNGPPEAPVFRYGISKERAYPGDKARKLDELIDFYEGMIFCGGNWSNQDWMHFQMGGNTYGADNVDKVNDFIRRKIRADGFSTFNRTSTPSPPPPPEVPTSSAVDVLSRAAGITTAKAAEILPTMSQGLRLAQATNANRIAMDIAQWGHESASFVYTEEIAKNGRYAPYIGRTWIQITWDSNYRAFSQWCYEQQLVPTATYFVDNPKALADLRWAGIGPAWYTVVARPNLNALADQRNLVAVTQAINGGQNGAADRKLRYDRASALGEQLLTLISDTSTGDDMAQVPQAEWADLRAKMDRVFHEVADMRKSRSPLRRPGEKTIDTWSGFGLNVDGSEHVQICVLLAGYNHAPTIALLEEVAAMTPQSHPDEFPERLGHPEMAQAILAETAAARATVGPPQVTVAAPTPLAPVSSSPPSIVNVTQELSPNAVAQIRDIVVQAAVGQQTPLEPVDFQPATSFGQTTELPATSGQLIGQALDALTLLKGKGDLDAGEKAALAGLTVVLNTMAGDTP